MQNLGQVRLKNLGQVKLGQVLKNKTQVRLGLKKISFFGPFLSQLFATITKFDEKKSLLQKFIDTDTRNRSFKSFQETYLLTYLHSYQNRTIRHRIFSCKIFFPLPGIAQILPNFLTWGSPGKNAKVQGAGVRGQRPPRLLELFPWGGPHCAPKSEIPGFIRI